MPRALFEKTGNSVWISHLDLMRVFQRAFKRAGLPLTHSKGFNPRASVSIALPMSVGIESCCELLDFDLETDNFSCDEITSRLNACLINGVKVLDVYEDAQKIKHLALMDCLITLEYDNGVPENCCNEIAALFNRESVVVEKKSKNGVTQQDLIPMIRSLHAEQTDPQTVTIVARICCQNPSLNPMQIDAAIRTYLPDMKADFVKFRRLEIYDTQEKIFR